MVNTGNRNQFNQIYTALALYINCNATVQETNRTIFQDTAPTSGSVKQGYIYRVSQEECARLREGVTHAKIYRYNPKHLCPKWNGYGDNGQRSLKL